MIQNQQHDEEAEHEGQERGPEVSERQEKIAVAFDLQLGNANLENQQRNGDGEHTIAERFEA